MKRRSTVKSILGILLAILMLTGCGGAEQSTMSESMVTNGASGGSMKDVYLDSGFVTEESIQVESSMPEGSDVQVQDPLANRKLIKTVDMSVETKEFDQLMATLETRVAELGGYIENLETYNGSIYSNYRSSRNADMTIRIPQKQLNSFLDEVGSFSNVIRRSENVQDVTLSYVDLESHKKVLQAEQDRLLELFNEANQMEDILTIERRLTEVRYQLETMESQLRTYDNKIDYSTVNLHVNEVKELTPVEERTVLQRMGDDFAENLQDVGHGLVELAIWFVGSIPYFVVWIVVIIIIILIIKLILKGLKKRGKSGKKNKNVKTAVVNTTENEQKE